MFPPTLCGCLSRSLPHPHLPSLVFLILAILAGLQWYSLVTWICIFVITKDAEQILTCLLPSKYILWWNVHFNFIVLSFTWALCFSNHWRVFLSFESSVHLPDTSSVSDCDLQIFIPVCDLVFHSIKQWNSALSLLNFEVQVIIF